MKSIIKQIISLILTRQTGNTAGESVFKFKVRHKPIYNLIYGSVTDEEVFSNVAEKLHEKSEILMIHSSLNGMLPVYKGNPGKLLSILISFCKKNNVTLAMPAFLMGSNYEVVNRYRAGKTIFDVRKTVSEMGMLSELFRITPGVKRSLHPTHSICAYGPLAEQLVANHYKAGSTFGDGTPFDFMNKHKTRILGIGLSTIQALSQIHVVEDIMKDDYPIPLYSDILPVKCRDDSGNLITYNLRIKNAAYLTDLKSLKKILKKVNSEEWKYKGIPFFMTEAKIVTDTFVDAAKMGLIMYKKA